MVKPGFKINVFPFWFSLLNIDPTQILNDFLILVYSTINEKVFSEHAGRMILSSFGKVPRSLEYLPLIFLCTENRQI